jgi:hypothetical protein
MGLSLSTLHHDMQGTSYMAEVSAWLRRHFAAKAVTDPAYANLRVGVVACSLSQGGMCTYN